MSITLAPQTSRPPVPASAGTEPVIAHRWSALRLVAFRFAFAFFVLLAVPMVLYAVPFASALGDLLWSGWSLIVPWVAVEALGMPRESLALQPFGSGDQAFHWVQMLCQVLLAAGVAVVWSVLDRRRRHYRQLSDGLRTLLRFYVGAAMISYGFSKVSALWGLGQMPPISDARLIQPLGSMSPMGFLWTFMGYSPAYQAFTGFAELAGGLLLFWRRTATLGALITAGVMINVVMLNFTFDVPVKLYSSLLLISALAIAARDAGRLVDVLILHRASPEPAPLPRWHARWDSRTARRILGGATAAFVALLLVREVQGSISWRAELAAAGAQPLIGIWSVEAVNGTSAELQLPAAAPGWRRVALEPNNRGAVQYADDAFVRYAVRADTAERTLTFRHRGDTTAVARFAFTQDAADVLELVGTADGENVSLRLRRQPPVQSLLMTRGFHWISPISFNR